MTKRNRANGDGSVYWNRSKKRWVGAHVVGYGDDGRPRRRTVQATTKAKARERLAELKRHVDGGAAKIDQRLTVKQWAQYWLTDLLPARDVKDSTEQSYRDIANRYVIPTWGSKTIARLSPVDVEHGLNRLARQDYSQSTVRHAKRVLSFICNEAERDGRIVRNPCTTARLPKCKPPRERRAMSTGQARQLLEHVRGTPLEAPVTIALATGVRLGELLALQWSDLDLKRAEPTMGIRRSKTKRGQRVIKLPPSAVATLRAHRAAQNEIALACGPAWTNADLVFPSEVGTTWDKANFRHRFQQACRESGIGHWTPHELRHTAASWLIIEGVPLKEIADMLGHASITITADVYGHLFESSSRVAAVMEQMLVGASARSA